VWCSTLKTFFWNLLLKRNGAQAYFRCVLCCKALRKVTLTADMREGAGMCKNAALCVAMQTAFACMLAMTTERYGFGPGAKKSCGITLKHDLMGHRSHV